METPNRSSMTLVLSLALSGAHLRRTLLGQPGTFGSGGHTNQAAAHAQGCTRRQSVAVSNLSGLSLQEAQQILSNSKLSPEEVLENYEHLFEVNDKPMGSSFYLQSKVVRAKEYLDEELRIQAQEDRGKGQAPKM
ncbi:mitochondrial import inner membrane translocase subunit TIM16 [Tupaia chinensis]|uniref:mitochondrial import inner membrane translocase subunit TIM16 n=1 Tax=Tupaia chinensis TaxID=246437 RepID=UPI0003C90D34|nr:mitochondrial import inner membrane translocase subunit TIM16 [Tupaia chinensis]